VGCFAAPPSLQVVVVFIERARIEEQPCEFGPGRCDGSMDAADGSDGWLAVGRWFLISTAPVDRARRRAVRWAHARAGAGGGVGLGPKAKAGMLGVGW